MALEKVQAFLLDSRLGKENIDYYTACSNSVQD